MNKIVISLVGLVCSLSLFTGEGIHDALGALSQSLEMLSKEVKPVEGKKEPWVIKDCFELFDENHSFKVKKGCNIIKDQPKYAFPIKDAAQDLVNVLGFENIVDPDDVYTWASSSFAKAYNIEKSIAYTLEFIMSKKNERSFRLHKWIQRFVLPLVIMLFFQESRNPGSWNNDFDSKITDPESRDIWKTFMEKFRERMEKEGWPYRKKSA